MGRENRSLRTAAALLAIVLLVAALAQLWRMNHRRTQAVAAANEQRQGEMSAERRTGRLQGTEALRLLRQNIAPLDIVLWGDDLAAGSGESVSDEALAAGVSEAACLEDVLNERLLGRITGKLVSAGALSRTDGLRVQVFDNGVADERMEEILARAGVLQVLTGSEITVPGVSGYRYADLDLVTSDHDLLLFAKQRAASLGVVTILGIEGHLYDGSERYDEKHIKLAFSRDATGEETAIPAGTPVQLESADKYRSCTPVLMVEDGGAAGFTADRIGDLQAILDRHAPANSAYVVVCATGADSRADEALEETFGDHYLRLEVEDGGMTEKDYETLAGRIFDCLDGQGQFDGIREAVQTAEGLLQ